MPPHKYTYYCTCPPWNCYKMPLSSSSQLELLVSCVILLCFYVSTGGVQRDARPTAGLLWLSHVLHNSAITSRTLP
jgi:hypothetical protein